MKISKYRILGLVGQGQFGQVFCGCHRKTGQIFALKNLDRHRFPTHKFLRELRFLLLLQHPNIVTCHSLEHTRTGRYLVMDYCEGGTLRQLMEMQAAPWVESGLKLALDLLAGLEHAHSRGIVHCDIKPENILLTAKPGGWLARISDFGIARLSQELAEETGNTGSPAYMAPERFYGQYSPASDLYAVGVMLFELLAGYRPFSGPPGQLMSAHLNQPVKIPPQVPPEFHGCILKALQKLPGRRFHSASEMLAALLEAQARWLEGQAPREQSEKVGFSPIQGRLRTEGKAEGVRQLGTVRSPIVGIAIVDKQLIWATQTTLTRYVSRQSFNFKAPIQALLPYQRGCLAVTEQEIYDLKLWGLEATPQRVAQFASPRIAAVEPQGRWIATATQGQPLQGSEFQIVPLTGSRRRKTGLNLSLAPRQLLALDSRHIAAIAAVSPTETLIQILTRRQTSIGVWRLPVSMDRAILGNSPYQLLAIAPHPTLADTTELILLDLKPFRLRRIVLDLAPPVCVAVTSWGYAVGHRSGWIVLLDGEGTVVGRLDLEDFRGLQALIPYQTSGLIASVFHQDRGGLYLLDLRQFEIDLVF
ncbi:serine/threonine protein kinase [Desertifilum sp. FACHB-1129]|uniref:Protein kinase domain-containing protein n=1 Tax=Desertifilum tharense IPPAS B-1220 TaxID=1781255 RepID=A0A1E5QLR1_9CYAN|nr:MULTISPECIES: serine/threonine-protein kinase [Desertifilum]MDA0211997.1 serine/threonine-protein kinase [Cyanobacteria bacterium FC1]MBD2313277.1 serine/threonine protein kinase [Desertifilum sp. FACHB-1129]MBD2324262.1 serine/threonine protein kinase [Desertifilum sp. FACHB-866]MBD2334277.1 serine/threonine protein kinase [Desertifilum sp. FACHB-868]OEJ75616.1 hypothetical protein BH720_08735 [Desertifilum tharense IPPAS B-1220]